MCSELGVNKNVYSRINLIFVAAFNPRSYNVSSYFAAALVANSKTNLSLYSLYYTEACNEFTVSISTS